MAQFVSLPLRLALLYTLLLGIALWFFGFTAYQQTEQQSYHNLDTLLSSRAASVRLGKDIIGGFNNNGTAGPIILNSVDGLGTQGVAIEVFDAGINLLATTTNTGNYGPQSSVDTLVPSPVPWDAQTIRTIKQHHPNIDALYSTIHYQGQTIRVYTLRTNDFGSEHFIQTARSEQDIVQTLSNLRLLLIRGGLLTLIFAFIGGWCITWSVLALVRRMTRTAQSISSSRDFSKRISGNDTHKNKRFPVQDELSTLAETFNQMLASLEEAYQRQQRFIADASHELRAPITSIRCNLDLLSKAPDLPESEVQAALDDARAETARMGRLVNDLLLLAHADASTNSNNTRPTIEKHTQIIDLDSLLLEIYRQYAPIAPDNDVHSSHTRPLLQLQTITPTQVCGDADQLKQVFVALLDNAFKYTPYEGSITLSLTQEHDNALVTVQDTGIGISPEDMPYIFERFYRADRARTRNRGGSGLGLAIVQAIVQEHRGSVQVESVPGKGSIFTVRIPLSVVR